MQPITHPGPLKSAKIRSWIGHPGSGNRRDHKIHVVPQRCDICSMIPEPRTPLAQTEEMAPSAIEALSRHPVGASPPDTISRFCPTL